MTNEQVKILLVEDDPFLLSMYSAKFELENFEVFIADNGETGLKIAKEERPGLILLDIKLPKMNGFEVLSALKDNENTKNILVILLTNVSQKEEREKGLALGAIDYLVKAHFMPSEVVNKVKGILKI